MLWQKVHVSLPMKLNSKPNYQITCLANLHVSLLLPIQNTGRQNILASGEDHCFKLECHSLHNTSIEFFAGKLHELIHHVHLCLYIYSYTCTPIVIIIFVFSTLYCPKPMYSIYMYLRRRLFISQWLFV